MSIVLNHLRFLLPTRGFPFGELEVLAEESPRLLFPEENKEWKLNQEFIKITQTD